MVETVKIPGDDLKLPIRNYWFSCFLASVNSINDVMIGKANSGISILPPVSIFQLDFGTVIKLGFVV